MLSLVVQRQSEMYTAEVDEGSRVPVEDVKVPTYENVRDAVFRGDVAACRELLSRGAYVDGRDPQGRTLLFWAATIGKYDVCKMLLDAGATQDADAIGQTPFISAVLQGNARLCELLLDSAQAQVQAQVNVPFNEDGERPLFFAAMLGNLDVCALLLNRGATHAPDKNGKTPLFCAAEYGRADVCRLLLERGATQEPDAEGRTPLSIAESLRNADVRKVLRARA